MNTSSSINFMILYSLLLSFFISIKMYPQQPEWLSFNSQNSGLQSDQLVDILIDNSGGIWLGTANGVTSFDGVEWDVFLEFTAVPAWEFNQIGLVHVLYQDNDGLVWAGSQNGMVAPVLTFDGESWSPHEYTPFLGQKDAILHDSNQDYWFGGYGLSLIADDFIVDQYFTNNSVLPSNNIQEIVENPDGRVWVGTSEGLVSIDQQIWTVHTSSVSQVLSDNIRVLEILETNELLVGTVSGIGIFDGVDWSFLNTNNSDLPSNCITDIKKDVASGFWVATCDNGIAHFNGSNWQLFNTSNSGIASDFVTSIEISSDSTLWIATGESGLSVYKDGGLSLSSRSSQESITDKIMVFPNPASRYIDVKVKGNIVIESLEILSIQGATLDINFDFQDSQRFEGLEILSSGSYILRINTNQGTTWKRLSIQ